MNSVEAPSINQLLGLKLREPSHYQINRQQLTFISYDDIHGAHVKDAPSVASEGQASYAPKCFTRSLEHF